MISKKGLQMKISILSAILMLLGILTLGMAESTVDEQITAIQNAAPKERVRLMNEFKKMVSDLSVEERKTAITQLRSRVQSQTRNRERSRINQMEETEYMKREEYMHQHQVANQAMKQGVSGGSGTTNRFMGHK